MGIRNFEQYLTDCGLVHTTPLTALANTRLGIDALTYLRGVTSNPNKVEPYTPSATGGVPLTLTSQIEKDLKLLERLRIKPVFVFNGIRTSMERPFATSSPSVPSRGPPHTPSTPSSPSFASASQPATSPRMSHAPGVNATPHSTEMDTARTCSRAWLAYENARTDEAKSLFASTRSPLSSVSSPPSIPPGDLATSFQADLLRLVHRTFKHRTVEFVVAPYLAIAQLLYLERHPKQYVHSIWGPDELLMFDLQSLGAGVRDLSLHKDSPGPLWDRVILDIDFSPSGPPPPGCKADEPYFRWVSKSEILQNLGLNSDQFLDLAILAGFEYAPTFPPLIQQHHNQYGGPPVSFFSFKPAIDLIRQYTNGQKVLQFTFPQQEAYMSLPHPYANKAAYHELFQRSRLLFKYALVFTAHSSDKPNAPHSTCIVPLPLALPQSPPSHSPRPTGMPAIPSDLHILHTNRLPDELYLHLFRGLCDARLLNALTSGYWKEDVPLDLVAGPGDTDDWKRFVRDYCTEQPTTPRCAALALVVQTLHKSWNTKKVHAVYHFDPTKEHLIQHTRGDTRQLVESVNLWNVDSRFIEEELRRQNSSTIDMLLCLGATTKDPLALRTKTPKIPSKLLEKKDEIVANVLWRFLELRKFLLPTHQHTHWGNAMYHALKEARVNDKFQETLFLAMELIRGGVLHNGRYGNRVWSGGPKFGDESEKKSMLLVMRVVSIVSLNFKPEAWSSAPLSRELLTFNAFLRTLNRSLRSLIEAISVSMLLRGDARRQREDFIEIALSLPFQTDTGTGMGILFKGWGDAVTAMCGGTEVIKSAGAGNAEDREKVEAAKGQTLEMLESAFSNVRNVRAELERGMRFWDVVFTAVKTLAASGPMSPLDPNLYAQFEAADIWLNVFRI